MLYELDSRIDHILIDEAQDTSPEQWEIVEQADLGFLRRARARATACRRCSRWATKSSRFTAFRARSLKLLAAYGTVYEDR